MMKFCDENFFVLFNLNFSFETMWIWMWTFLSKFCLLIFTGVNLFSKIFGKITVCFQLGSGSGSGEIFEIRVQPKWIRVRVNIGSGQGRPVQILKGGGNNFFFNSKNGGPGGRPLVGSMGEALRKIRFLTKYAKFGGLEPWKSSILSKLRQNKGKLRVNLARSADFFDVPLFFFNFSLIFRFFWLRKGGGELSPSSSMTGRPWIRSIPAAETSLQRKTAT